MSEPLRKRSETLSGTVALAAYTSAVCLSAFLLFAVQPMFARMVLPRFGGSPSVWSVAMVFFQSMLFAGYAYAHLLARIRHRVTAVAVPLPLLCPPRLTLPLSIARRWSDPAAAGTAPWP